jgi:hypothetical protein
VKALLVLAGVLLSGCSLTLLDPVKVDSKPGVLDLSNWNFDTQGPVEPQAWLWDPVLWTPANGRPNNPPQPLGPPDRGGLLAHTLMQPYGLAGIPLRAATASIKILVPDSQNYGFQIGALPGADRVWVNGSVVWESGVLSLDASDFRAEGAGTVVTVQPKDGVLDIVAEIVSNDPLIRHPEVNRLWIVGPAAPMLASDTGERSWRFLQVSVLVIGIVAFGWISRLRPERRTMIYFTWFLASCLAKLVFNVEQPEPLLNGLLPGIPLSVYLILNHALNLLPFPLVALFLIRQFPLDLKMPAFWVITGAGIAATLWELLPFVVLGLGWEPLYSQIMRAQWAFFLNFYVVLATLFLFERFYHVFMHKRPLSKALFVGGVLMGLIVLLPVPLSYFIPVKHTYFLGWGMFLFLAIQAFALIQLQVKSTDREIRDLKTELERRGVLAHFVSSEWASRLGRESIEAIRPGDQREADAKLVQVWSPRLPEEWLALVGQTAGPWKAVLAGWQNSAGVWVLEALPEAALAFALDVRRAVPDACVAVAAGRVTFRVIDLGSRWMPLVTGMPVRLGELGELARQLGTVVLDAELRDGLVVGGWRRHRLLSESGTEIELYETDSEAEQKEATLDLWETALACARENRQQDAASTLRQLLSQHADRAAAALLARWETSLNRA